MQTPLYANAGDISSGNYSNPSLRPENRLHLLPEHIAQIATAFLKQLTLAPLKSREIRILMVIYSQTVGFNKREDDMNGKCLELLTGIRGDHANEAVRRLAALSMVVTRQGTHGKWMSINFNFERWGKTPDDSLTNEPRVLLSDEYQTPVPDEEAKTTVFQMHQLPAALATTTEKTVVKTDANPVIAKQEAIQATVSPPSDHDNAVPPSPPAQPSVAKPLREAFSIHYPSSLPQPLCLKMAVVISEITVQEHAQRLVDYFATCLQNGSVRKPMAYFTSLKNNLLNGKFDLSERALPDNKTAHSSQKTPVDKELPCLEAEYQLAMADYHAVKKTIESVQNTANPSFEAASASISYTKIWQKTVTRVDTITQKLKDYQQKNPSTSPVSALKKETVEVKRVRHESPQFIGDLLNSLQLLPS